MIVLEKIKNNLFFTVVTLAYIVMLIANPTMGMASVKNSGYYIKEMIMIMPVIFILTALLDMWIPKEKIMKFLGKEAGLKGVLLSLVVGSISAGPIYAAFPMCVMLHRKGASVRNVVIILSSWAVIKLPMLLNETKFLGMKFMAIRWALTVIAIIIFSWISSIVIKDEDLPGEMLSKPGLNINKDACIGCNLCVINYPNLFEMQGKKATVRKYDKGTLNTKMLKITIKACPVKAIEYIEVV